MARFPIKRVDVDSFGPFADLDLTFSDGVNIIIGDNATGKSQLLKLMYACTRTLKANEIFAKDDLGKLIADKLMGTFQLDKIGRLATRSRGRVTADIALKYAGIADELRFDFSTNRTSSVNVSSVPRERLQDEPVYLPPHELFSLGRAFVTLYDTYETGFEETWRDTAELLQRPALKGPRAKTSHSVLEPFDQILDNGTVVEEDGRLFLKTAGTGKLEAPLLAEGHRKLAMIVRLISNNVLLEGGYLFWDEPEANLNPASQKAVAQAIIALAEQGVQVFAATHSTFLIRELRMAGTTIEPLFIGLHRSGTDASADPSSDAQPGRITAQSSTDFNDLDSVAALHAEARQAEGFLAW